jgi:succinoglycan biosynthesis transport protein ExoP
MQQNPFKSASSVARADGTARGDVKHAADPWRQMRRALAGRFRLTVSLGMLIGSMGAIIGFYFSTPVYRSEGLVRISSVLPQALDETEQNRPMAMFDAYLQSQQMMIGSRGLLESAMQDQAWQGLAHNPSRGQMQTFANNLKVEFKPRTDYLRILYTDPDAQVAAAAVRSVVNAYEQAYESQQSDLRVQRIKALEDRRAILADRLNHIEGDIQARVTQLGAANLEPLYYSAMQQAMKMEASLADVRRALALAQTPQLPDQPSAKSLSPPITEITPEQIAMVDPIMRGYLDAQIKREDELARLRVSYGESHPQLARIREDFERGKLRIDGYAATVRAIRMSSDGQISTDKNPKMSTARSPEELRAQEKNLIALQIQTKKDMIELGTNRLQMDRLKLDEEAARKELADLTRKLGMIDTEGALGGRLSVVSRGDVPISPMLDRHIRDAAAGFAGGFLVPVLMLTLLGHIRPRYRCCSQAAGDLAASAPLFDAIPELPSKLHSNGSAAIAARGIHQMRVRLTSAAKNRKSSVYLITSASSGEGKTSLTLSLGASFAAAGFRTLIIDGDLVGRGITLGLGIEALPGLREAAESGTLRDLVRGTRESLCILPAGADDQLNAYAVPQTSIEALVQEARKHFSVVLIDTGAVFASIEASVLAPQADGVVFAVACGQREALVAQAMDHLESLGAHFAAIVFNGPAQADCESSMQTAKSAQFFNRARRRKATQTTHTVLSGFGPMVDSVLSSLPANCVGDFENLYQDPATIPHPQSIIPKAA